MQNCKVWNVARYNFCEAMREKDAQWVRMALDYAKGSAHPDAVWLCQATAKCKCRNKDDLRHLVYELSSWNNGLFIALCSYYKGEDYASPPFVRRKHPFLQTLDAFFNNDYELVRDAAIVGGDCTAWRVLGYMHERRDEFEKALECFKTAADMGHPAAILDVVRLSPDRHDSECDERGCRYNFLHPHMYAKYLEAAEGGVCAAKACLLKASWKQITLCNFIPAPESEPFLEMRRAAFMVGEAVYSLDESTCPPAYLFWVKCVRDAMCVTSLICWRHGAPKDVRRLIAKKVWDQRLEWVHFNRDLSWRETCTEWMRSKVSLVMQYIRDNKQKDE